MHCTHSCGSLVKQFPISNEPDLTIYPRKHCRKQDAAAGGPGGRVPGPRRLRAVCVSWSLTLTMHCTHSCGSLVKQFPISNDTDLTIYPRKHCRKQDAAAGGPGGCVPRPQRTGIPSASKWGTLMHLIFCFCIQTRHNTLLFLVSERTTSLLRLILNSCYNQFRRNDCYIQVRRTS